MNGLMLAAVSPVVGSFLACAAVRLPDGRGLWGRSACPACDAKLTPGELVPVVSWLLLHGRCRSCGTPVPALYTAVELGAVAVAVAAALLFEGWRMWAGCGLGWVLLLLSAVDLRRQLLPDRLTLPLLAGGLAVAASFEPAALADRVLAAAGGWLAFDLLSAAYRRARGRQGLGGGDAKLLAAAGAWVGPMGLPWVVLIAALGGLAAVAALASRGGWRADRRLPFGPFLAAATACVWVVLQS